MSKEIKLENIDPVADIKNKVWQAADLIRGQVGTDEYFVLLFLLSRYNESNEFDKIRSNSFDESKIDLSSVKTRLERARKETLDSFFDFFEPSLTKLSDHALDEINKVFESFNTTVLKAHFSEIFEFVLFEIAKSQGKHGGEFMQPVELTRLMYG